MTLYYLATVYSIWNEGLQDAYDRAEEALAKLTMAGYHVYSPIVHNHYLGKYKALKDFDWLQEDKYQLDKCDALIVYKMPNWEKSKGISFEIGFMQGQGKSVVSLNYPTGAVIQLRNLYE